MPPRTPLIHPKTYFEDNKYAQLAGIGVFALYIVVTVLTYVTLLNTVIDQLDDSASVTEIPTTAVVISLGFTTILASAIGLVIVAGVMHVLSGNRVEGSFSNAVGVAAWAYAPNLVVWPLLYIDSYRRVQDWNLDGADTAEVIEQLEALDEPASLLSVAVGLVIIVWSVYILAKGTAGTHNVQFQDTIGPAVLVGLGWLVLMIFSANL